MKKVLLFTICLLFSVNIFSEDKNYVSNKFCSRELVDKGVWRSWESINWVDKKTNITINYDKKYIIINNKKYRDFILSDTNKCDDGLQMFFDCCRHGEHFMIKYLLQTNGIVQIYFYSNKKQTIYTSVIEK